MGVAEEFAEFLKEYKVTGLAVAFVIGGAVTTLVQSLVNQVIMPVIGVFMPQGNWQTATINVGSAAIGWGAFLSALINFIIIALLIFLVVRTVEAKHRKSSR